MEVDSREATPGQADPGAQPKLNNEQWQTMISLHWTLLHEHHDFFLASKHPSASPTLRRLAERYAMPAQLWCHGLHSFLERGGIVCLHVVFGIAFSSTVKCD